VFEPSSEKRETSSRAIWLSMFMLSIPEYWSNAKVLVV
jgi:hypothetical protein